MMMVTAKDLLRWSEKNWTIIELFDVTCQTRQLLRSNRKSSVVGSCNENISNDHPPVPWLRMIFKYLPDKRSLVLINAKSKTHLRSGGNIGISAADESNPSSNNWHSSTLQWSRQASEIAPGCCLWTREVGHHRRKPIITASNNKCLKRCQIMTKKKSHPSRRKSGTTVAMSILWQLGKLLYKAIDVVPANTMTFMLFTVHSVRSCWEVSYNFCLDVSFNIQIINLRLPGVFSPFCVFHKWCF